MSGGHTQIYAEQFPEAVWGIDKLANDTCLLATADVTRCNRGQEAIIAQQDPQDSDEPRKGTPANCDDNQTPAAKSGTVMETLAPIAQ